MSRDVLLITVDPNAYIHEEIEGTWVLLYNSQQRQFHVELLNDYLRENIGEYKKEGCIFQPWCLLYIGSFKECSKAGDELERYKPRKERPIQDLRKLPKQLLC